MANIPQTEENGQTEIRNKIAYTRPYIHKDRITYTLYNCVLNYIITLWIQYVH